MIFQEVNWIRSNAEKFCPALRKEALAWYKHFRFVPCFLQKYFKAIRGFFRKISVIVQLEESTEFKSCTGELAAACGCRVNHELHLIHSFTTRVNAKKLEQLIRHNKVKRIWHDREVKAVLDVATRVVNVTKEWDSNLTGVGIGVAVIDTGIYQHPDLAGRIIAFTDLVNGKTSAYDDNGHGTHVSGDIASSGSKSNSLYRGAAPKANLIGVKVLDKDGSGSLSTVIKGIEWCISNKEKYGIRVMNLSLGSPVQQSSSDDPVCIAVEEAWKSGIVVCIAAGNEGPESQSISSPGNAPSPITVGALNDLNTLELNEYSIAEFSSRGPTKIDNLVKPDVVSPGVNIVSLLAPKSTNYKQNKSSTVENYYISMSGTSMATPICSGVVALMLQASPSLIPDKVKELLKTSAVPLPNLPETVQGTGLIDAKGAIDKIKVLVSKP